MKNLPFTLTLCIVIACTGASFADVIYLKSGERVGGNIVASSGKTVMVETGTGEYKTYALEQIAKMEKGANIEIKKSVNPIIQKKSETIDEPKYILYVPKGIDYNKKYPLVIALSPSANASSMIGAWKNVAEKHKWLVLASKEFRNNVSTTDIFRNLSSIVSRDLSGKYPIDKSKVVATGFSGGGMGSHVFAFYYPRLISAVIPNVGAIHPECRQEKHKYPRRKLAVFLASPTDNNYEIMKKDRKFLEELGWKTKWIEFKGGHTMAPEKTYQESAAWLERNFR